jgi:hypothetical protein
MLKFKPHRYKKGPLRKQRAQALYVISVMIIPPNKQATRSVQVATTS